MSLFRRSPREATPGRQRSVRSVLYNLEIGHLQTLAIGIPTTGAQLWVLDRQRDGPSQRQRWPTPRRWRETQQLPEVPEEEAWIHRKQPELLLEEDFLIDEV